MWNGNSRAFDLPSLTVNDVKHLMGLLIIHLSLEKQYVLWNSDFAMSKTVTPTDKHIKIHLNPQAYIMKKKSPLEDVGKPTRFEKWLIQGKIQTGVLPFSYEPYT